MNPRSPATNAPPFTGVLADKIVVITGSARGLGRAYAEACCKAGAYVVVTDIREELGRATTAALTAPATRPSSCRSTSTIPIRSRRWAMRSARARPHRRAGEQGALATGLGGKPFETIQIEEWDRVMRVNTRSIWLAIKACAPYLRKSTAGKVVNISSDTALFGSDRSCTTSPARAR